MAGGNRSTRRRRQSHSYRVSETLTATDAALFRLIASSPLALPRQQTHHNGTKSPPAWCRISGQMSRGGSHIRNARIVDLQLSA